MASTADDLIDQARRETGLVDLGPDAFHEGLSVLLDGAEQSANFNELGTAVLRDQALGFLKTRLAVEDWYRRHPEIDDQEITAPLFGLGLPRTGSTALSFLLAQDPRTRSLRTWETYSPAPPPDPATYDTDPRIAETAARSALIDHMAPKFKALLPTSPTGPNECLQFLALDFRSAMLTVLADNPVYADWLEACDMVSAYRYHQRVLKLLQWRFPARPWRLKSPAHIHAIHALLEVYPDARFVMTHRDIAQVIPSVVSLIDATSEFLRVGPLAPDFATRQAGFWERGLRTALGYRDAGHEDRFFDIGFRDLQSDPLKEMTRLYEWLEMDLTDEVSGAMSAWWASNTAEKVAHEYHPEQYGIDLDRLRAQFAFYNDRFTGPSGH